MLSNQRPGGQAAVDHGCHAYMLGSSGAPAVFMLRAASRIFHDLDRSAAIIWQQTANCRQWHQWQTNSINAHAPMTQPELTPLTPPRLQYKCQLFLRQRPSVKTSHTARTLRRETLSLSIFRPAVSTSLLISSGNAHRCCSCPSSCSISMSPLIPATISRSRESSQRRACFNSLLGGVSHNRFTAARLLTAASSPWRSS